MRTVVIALATVAILTTPAYTQERVKGAEYSGSKQQQRIEQKKAIASERAYDPPIDRGPDQKYDPWRKIRGFSAAR
jgi:hypothetical protein